LERLVAGGVDAPRLDHLRPTITSIGEAKAMHAKLVSSAAATVKWLREFGGEPLAILKALRFEMVGYDPLTGEPLNVVEQLNQTFAILVSLQAIERLLELHPEVGGFRLALGTRSGRDIESVRPNHVAAEAFSATRPTSNQKLRKDLVRLAADTALHRYVFFASPGLSPGRHPELETPETQPNIQVHVIEL
jgi:hypothetical protein